MTMASHTPTPFLVDGFPKLVMGHVLSTLRGPTTTSSAGPTTGHHPSPGPYSARDLVRITTPFLDAVIKKLGPDVPDASDILLDGLDAVLSTTTKQSELPLSTEDANPYRKALAANANKIATALRGWTKEFASSDGDPNLASYSQCEGHAWTAEVQSVLFGPHSSRDLLHLYNEWLHRIVLLRDALLPFDNFEDVPLVIPSGAGNGLRAFEEARRALKTDLFAGRVSHGTIVDAAKMVTQPDLPKGGYGFQYAHGTVVPNIEHLMSASSASRLVWYYPSTVTDDNQGGVVFDHEFPSYFETEKSALSPAEKTSTTEEWATGNALNLSPCPGILDHAIEANGQAKDRRQTLRLRIDFFDAEPAFVDLGQICRGSRYAYRLDSSVSKEPRPDTRLPLHRPRIVSYLPRLADVQDLSASDDVHVIPSLHPALTLALLGKLYPESVVLVDADVNPARALETGKQFRPRLAIVHGL